MANWRGIANGQPWGRTHRKGEPAMNLVKRHGDCSACMPQKRAWVEETTRRSGGANAQIVRRICRVRESYGGMASQATHRIDRG